MSIFKQYHRRSPNKVVFCGLDNSGKSTIISFLEEGRFIEHTPTMGKELTEFEVEGTRISMFDMGGQSHFRKMWLGELKDAKCVVFVIDKSDSARFSEAKEEFKNLLPLLREKNKNIKLLIFANKHDLPTITQIGDIINFFDLSFLDNFEILETSAKTGYGMVNAFVKLYSALTGKMLKRFKLGKAIMLFNKLGELLYLEPNTLMDYSCEVLDSSVFKEFIDNPKIEEGLIKIESIHKGKFIVGANRTYIAVIYWTEDLDIPEEQSEQALKDLLDHIEQLDTPQIEEVLMNVKHFSTNIL